MYRLSFNEFSIKTSLAQFIGVLKIVKSRSKQLVSKKVSDNSEIRTHAPKDQILILAP
jgi:hypothetical protein